ncbi:MAG: efflux RND transporter permease subunit [Desulfotomaculales bacterium]
MPGTCCRPSKISVVPHLKITELAIKRPAAMAMIIMFFIVLGLQGYQRLTADLFPKTNIPFVTIVTTYPGAGAREVESQVVEPVEEAVSSVAGLKRTTSLASEGMAISVLEFALDVDSDVATLDVQKAVDAIMSRLPKEVDRPVIQKYNINAQPVMILALTGDRPAPALYRIAKDKIKQELESIPGVGKVTLVGGQEREIAVSVDRAKLEGYGLSINQVINRLQLENVNVPAGNLEQGGTEYTVRLQGEFKNLQELAETLIPFPGGSVALKDIARVEDTYTEAKEYARLDGRRAVAIVIQKQNEANIIKMSAAVLDRVARVKKELPAGVDLVVLQNNAGFIESALAGTRLSLLEGVLMTGLVLLFFLREWRSVFIVMLAIPTSIIATFMMMYFAGFSFNLLSLMALTLCVGILVDDSIVILENIHRHRRMGKDSEKAAIDGRLEIGMAAVAITMQDVVVFVPIAFMTGLVGQLFREFGLTVVFATLFSLFVSFTLTPMLSALLYKGGGGPAAGEGTPGGPSGASGTSGIPGKIFQQIFQRRSRAAKRAGEAYERLLLWALANRLKVVLAVGAAVAASVALIPLGGIGSEFLPNPDQARFTVNLELPPGTPLSKTDELVRQFEARIQNIPEVQHCLAMPGRSSDYFSTGPNNAQIEVLLSPKNERKRTVWQVADEVRGWQGDYPGLKVSIFVAGIVGTQEEGPPVQLEITGPDETVLASLAAKVQKIVENTPGAVDVRSTWKPAGKPEVQAAVDRRRASSYALSAAEIAQTVRACVSGVVAARYREEGKEYDIRVRLDRVDLASKADLEEVKIASQTGVLVPLKEVCRVTTGNGPPTISHLNRQKLIVIYANVKDRPLGDVTGEIQKALEQVDFPDGYRVQFYGAQKDMQETFADLIRALILAAVLVYMVLVILYESFLTPFVRMLSLPCGAIGALWALYLTGSTFNLVSLIGLVLLDGLAAKNGTLLIDYTNTLLKRGLPLQKALVEAGTTRLRPIVMTAATMVGGMLPTAFALAEGSEIRKTMAVAIIGGLVTTTLLTPVLIPVAYTLLEYLKSRLLKTCRRLKGPGTEKRQSVFTSEPLKKGPPEC